MLRWKDKKISGMDKQRFLRNAGTYTVLVMALMAMTFFGVCSPKENLGLPSGAAAKVAGDRITPNEFNRAYRNTYERFQGQFSENFDPATLGLSRMVLRQLIDERILYREALSAGIEAQEDDVTKLLVDAKAFRDEKGDFNAEAFSNYLRGNGYTEASFTDELRRSITVQRFRQFATYTTYVSKKAAELDYRLNETKMDIEFLKLEPKHAHVQVSAEEVDKFLDEAGKKRVKEYYEQNKADYVQAEQVKARHILISYTGARNATADAAKRSKADAQARAHGILTKAKSGVDFVQLAKESTDEPSGKSSGGDLGFFNRESMVKEFSDAAFAMKEGAISELVESPFGFHIIKVEGRKAAKDVAVEAAEKDIARKLLEKDKAPTILQQKADEILALLKAGNPQASDKIKEMGLSWADTGSFALSSKFVTGIGSEDEVLTAAASLQKPGTVYDKALDVRGTKFILRLKNITAPDLAKLDDKKIKELAESAAMSQGYAFFSAMEKSMRKDLEERGKIWENPDYLALDSRAKGRSGS